MTCCCPETKNTFQALEHNNKHWIHWQLVGSINKLLTNQIWVRSKLIKITFGWQFDNLLLINHLMSYVLMITSVFIELINWLYIFNNYALINFYSCEIIWVQVNDVTCWVSQLKNYFFFTSYDVSVIWSGWLHKLKINIINR